MPIRSPGVPDQPILHHFVKTPSQTGLEPSRLLSLRTHARHAARPRPGFCDARRLPQPLCPRRSWLTVFLAVSAIEKSKPVAWKSVGRPLWQVFPVVENTARRLEPASLLICVHPCASVANNEFFSRPREVVSDPYSTGESFPNKACRTILIGAPPCFINSSWNCSSGFP